MDGYISKLSEDDMACHRIKNWKNNILHRCLNRDGYYEEATTPGIWRHIWRSIISIIIVDKFFIEYAGERHTHHMNQSLQEYHTINTDWEGTIFVGVETD